MESLRYTSAITLAYCLVFSPGSVPGAEAKPALVDLTRIERTIAREPVYQSKAPKYCLLVLGLEARTRIWLVLDGDVLYVDRNGTGDLTALFYGRSHIPGLVCGARVRLTGPVGQRQNSGPVMTNPAYELLFPTGE